MKQLAYLTLFCAVLTSPLMSYKVHILNDSNREHDANRKVEVVQEYESRKEPRYSLEHNKILTLDLHGYNSLTIRRSSADPHDKWDEANHFILVPGANDIYIRFYASRFDASGRISLSAPERIYSGQVKYFLSGDILIDEQYVPSMLTPYNPPQNPLMGNQSSPLEQFQGPPTQEG